MKEYAEKVLVDPKFPPEWPYSPEDFERYVVYAHIVYLSEIISFV